MRSTRRTCRRAREHLEEMHAFPCAIEKTDVDFAEVMRKVSRQALKANEWADRRRTQRADEIVERRLSTGIPSELSCMYRCVVERSMCPASS